MDDDNSLRSRSAGRVEPVACDVDVRGTVFRLVRRPGAAFVGLLRMGRVAGGELFGYVARMNARPVCRVFPRHAGVHPSQAALTELVDAAVQFHVEQSRCEAVGHG